MARTHGTGQASGYSGTPLAQKLGIKEGARLALLHAPAGFNDELDLPAAVKVTRSANSARDVVVLFVTERVVLERSIERLEKAIFPDGAIWVGFPKKASKVPTDMTDHVVREIALPRGLVDNKVCAIDDVWTGVRICWRLERRR